MGQDASLQTRTWLRERMLDGLQWASSAPWTGWELLRMLDSQIHLDDRASHVEKLRGGGINAYLLDRSWNHDCVVDEEYASTRTAGLTTNTGRAAGSGWRSTLRCAAGTRRAAAAKAAETVVCGFNDQSRGLALLRRHQGPCSRHSALHGRESIRAAFTGRGASRAWA